MDKIVYLYGSARDARTRTLRRYSYPRGEMQVRIGPWLVRPARRMAVETTRILPYVEDLLKKVSAGLLQVQRADTSVISPEEVRSWTAPEAKIVADVPPPPPVESAVAAVEAAVAPAEEPSAPALEPEPVGVEAPAEPEPVAAEPEAAAEEAPVAEEGPSRESLLPSDWRQFTAKDLQSLCAEHGITLTKTTKSAAVAAIESWIGGN